MLFLALSLVSAMADGDMAMSRGDYAAAAQHYRAEAEANPGSYEAKFNLARSLAFSNHRDEAIGSFRSCWPRGRITLISCLYGDGCMAGRAAGTKPKLI